ncbi:MAG: hypothetical protein K940chlam9_00253 [Chlamydiae bacterium]|nr:hypothetical protein [Chlamydiota bacterium]
METTLTREQKHPSRVLFEGVSLFPVVVFLYFFTLHADQLSLPLFGVTVRFNNLIAFLLLVVSLLSIRLSLIRLSKEMVWGGVAVLGSVTLSFLFSPYKGRCLVFLFWTAFTLGGYLFLPYLLVRYGDLQKIWSLYFLSFLGVGCYAALQFALSIVGIREPFVTQDFLGSLVRTNAFAYEPSYYALYMTPFVMLINYVYLADPNRSFFLFERVSFPVVLTVNLLFLLSTATSALFTYFPFLFLLIWTPGFSYLRGRLIRFFGFFLLGGVFLYVLFPAVLTQFFLKFFFSGFMGHHSFFERWEGIENAWKIFCDHPLFGVGLGGVPSHLFSAWLDGSTRFHLPPDDLLAYKDCFNPLKFFEPMNVATELLASLGIVGAGAFTTAFFFLFRLLKRSYSQDPILLIGFLLSTLVSLFALQFNQGLLRTYIWVHFSLVFATGEKLLNPVDCRRC